MLKIAIDNDCSQSHVVVTFNNNGLCISGTNCPTTTKFIGHYSSPPTLCSLTLASVLTHSDNSSGHAVQAKYHPLPNCPMLRFGLRIARYCYMKFRTPHLKKGNLYIVMKPTPKLSLKSSTQGQCFP